MTHMSKHIIMLSKPYQNFDLLVGMDHISFIQVKKDHFIKFVYVLKYKRIRLLLMILMIHIPIRRRTEISHEIVCEHYFNYSI